MRIILYTGKGGVGKTSVSAATALRAAELGYKTVVMSTDTAHSLSDSLDVQLGNSPVKVAENLWGQEVDVLKELDTHWKAVQDWLSALMRWQGAEEVIAEELAVLPGMEELVALLYINQYQKQRTYDVMVVDCAPTGETLRLLSFPDMARWYMNRLFPLERRVMAALRPLARGVMKIPVPGVDVFDTVQSLYTQLEEMRELLMDGSCSSVRLVVNPEKMVVKEAQRTFTYLNLYGYQTDMVVCNKVLPENSDSAFIANWRESQEKYLDMIHESFDPVPVLKAPYMDQEVVGLDSLRNLASHIYGEDDPSRVYCEGLSQQIVTTNGKRILNIKLPFTSKEDLDVIENNDELTIQVGQYRRNIFLPRALAGLGVDEARMDGDNLIIVFGSGAS